MPAAETSLDDEGQDVTEDLPDGTVHDRRFAVRLYEAAIALPTLTWLIVTAVKDPHSFVEVGLINVIVWTVGVAAAELMPVPTNVPMGFSLSFPIELSAALLFPTPIAATIAFVGSGDAREFRGKLPPLKALFIRSEIALTVATEALIFHSLGTTGPLGTPTTTIAWLAVALAVLPAATAGYSVNVLFVAVYYRLQVGKPVVDAVKEMHAGVFGEFLVSYMGLALFAVLVATGFQKLQWGAIFVFIAPLAFARQMFFRSHSLQEATNELAAKQAENEHQALHDSLTGLPNRMLFQQKLAGAIDEARKHEGRLAVMLMDLDHFKEINDTLGHHFGDLLLKQIGPRLSNVLRDVDMMARLGGDEFGLLLPDLPSREVAVKVADRLLEELERPISVEGLALDVSGSIGIALYPPHADDAESLLRRADVAMYAAKEAGGGYELYHEDLDRHNPQRLTLIGQVRPAVEHDEFVMFYQPKVRLIDGRVAGAEALIRWQHPTLGLVSPDEFIPLVEKTVLLRPLTHYILGSVLRQWRQWADMGIRLPIAINISPRSLLDQQLPDQVRDQLRKFDVPPAFLRLELTESFLMADSGRSTGVLDRLSDVGVGLSIDDFGTGYSSLSHLKRLPIEEIKIDRSFVMQMHVDANDFMIVRATVDLGRNLGLRVVAEGVEDLATFDRLAEFGCDEAQGYYVSRPVSAMEFTRWLSMRNLDRDPGVGAPVTRRRDDEVPAERGRLHIV